MSAWIVHPRHIAALTGAGINLQVRWHAPEEPRPGERTHQRGQPWGPDQVAKLRRVTREASDATARDVALMLRGANVTSVAHRYATTDPRDLPGHSYTPEADTWEPYTCRRAGRALSPVALLCAIDSYEYQSCEHPGWEGSEAETYCDALRRAVIHTLPGYDDAEWDPARVIAEGMARETTPA